MLNPRIKTTTLTWWAKQLQFAVHKGTSCTWTYKLQ